MQNLLKKHQLVEAEIAAHEVFVFCLCVWVGCCFKSLCRIVFVISILKLTSLLAEAILMLLAYGRSRQLLINAMNG